MDALDPKNKNNRLLNQRLSCPLLDPKEIKIKATADHLNNKFQLPIEQRQKMIDTKEALSNDLYKTLS